MGDVLRRLSLSFLAFALLAAGPASGDTLPIPLSPDGWFLRTRAVIGLGHSDAGFATEPPGALDSERVSYDPQEFFGVGAGLGYRWEAWGIPVRSVVDGSVNYRYDSDVRADFADGSRTYQANVRIWDVRFSMLADVLQFGWGSLYAGAGIGASFVETEVGSVDPAVESERSEWKVAPSVEIGVVFDRIFGRVAPELSYRFRPYGDLQSDAFPGGEALAIDDLYVHDIMFGFTVPLQGDGVAAGSLTAAGSAPSGAYDWTGFHVGGFAGAASVEATARAVVDSSGEFYNAGDSYGFDSNGLLAGGEIGVDWQWRWLVLGLAGEVGLVDLSDSAADPGAPGGDTTSTFETDWYAVSTARVGLAYDRLLFFGRVGAGYLHGNAGVSDSCTAAPCSSAEFEAADEDALLMFTAGGGLEYAFSDRWSAGLEYRFFHVFDDLEPRGTASPGGSVSQTVVLDDIQTVRAALNYRW